MGSSLLGHRSHPCMVGCPSPCFFLPTSATRDRDPRRPLRRLPPVRSTARAEAGCVRRMLATVHRSLSRACGASPSRPRLRVPGLPAATRGLAHPLRDDLRSPIPTIGSGGHAYRRVLEGVKPRLHETPIAVTVDGTVLVSVAHLMPKGNPTRLSRRPCRMGRTSSSVWRSPTRKVRLFSFRRGNADAEAAARVAADRHRRRRPKDRIKRRSAT
jgi:hypothetical protein